VSFSQITSLIGGLAVFLFGMKLMSESLQHAAGDGLKSMLARMTSNKFSAVFSGFAITSTIQSSSATTVMVVGFVNAGLLTLSQAIGVIMGANIGTTVTAWLVSFLGFKLNISLFALPLIAIGVALLFSRKDKLISWGNSLIGFGLLFLGLKYLKSSIPDAATHPDTFRFLAQYADQGFYSILIFLAIGTLITVIIQSSSATLTITITLAYSGHIPYEAAIAMVLGENIGTTITANLAALAGNINSKKAALAHTVFNLIGVFWILIVLRPVLAFIGLIIPGDPLIDKTMTRFNISFFHTLFNLLNTIFLIWFIPQIEKLVGFALDRFEKGDLVSKETFNFQLLAGGSVKTSDLAVIEINEHAKKIIQDALKNFNLVAKLIGDKKAFKKIHILFENEERLDKFRNQMLSFLTQIQESGVTGQRAKEILVLIDRVKILEEIGDIFARIARKIKNAGKIHCQADDKRAELLFLQIEVIREHYSLIKDNLELERNPSILKISKGYRNKVKDYFDKMQERVQKEKGLKKPKLLSILYCLDLSRYLDDLSNNLNMLAETGK
jgi:phosphate:Na+ symporter